MAFSYTDEDGDLIEVARSSQHNTLLTSVVDPDGNSHSVYIPFSEIPKLIEDLAGYLG
ncbi:hypothetical protein SEA_STROSAHL_79 [Gordonia phage Strosahl]|uniref:Uncharacterized protein n=2 Tax=Soupsvirus strosahl TaxID=2560510 RepID=A0A1B3B1G7_9CAUD|nr:hypothetical protein BIZ67_gp031 [Gordonia phage Remus]YP_009596280.1 hypothetical protein FDH03_gp031 [Gordonia phage Strosahl]AOE44685.1 hypothetical protein SEA_REMUS_79 [Gordonia phage Remus]AOE44789.1 hypothetical protein SEA_STROSAHL_79 [Gordonia phage Strosahl]